MVSTVGMGERMASVRAPSVGRLRLAARDRSWRNGGSLLPPFFYTGAVSGGEPIYLVGMMGVGKSTVGALLAEVLDRGFIDTDREIERMTGRNVAQIFEQDGEARFRELERAAIEKTFERTPSAVFALGGGAIVQPGMLDRLKSRGPIIYLRATPEALSDRIGDGASRPLLAGLSAGARVARLAALLETRRVFYEQADHSIDAEEDAAAVVQRIREFLDRRTVVDPG